MKISKRVFMSGLLSLFLAGMLGTGQAAPEAESKKKAVDQDRDVLFARIKRSLAGYNMNNEEKYFIQEYFSPLHAMSAYRELLLWSMTYSDDDPFRQDVMSMVRGSLVAVFRDSGAGVPLVGWKGAGQPISLAFWRSIPRYAQIPNFNDLSTLKWETVGQEKKVSPATIGQSLAAKALFIATDQSPEGRQVAPVLLLSALQELEILGSELFYKEGLGRVQSGGYIADGYAINDKGQWRVINKSSQLFSQASLLLGLLHLHDLLSTTELVSPLFANGPIQGKSLAEWQKLTRKYLDQVYVSTVANHFDEKSGSFASGYNPVKGHNNRIIMDDAGIIGAALNALLRVLPKSDPLQESARKYLLSQAAFIKDAIGEKPSVPRGFLLTNKARLKSLLPIANHTVSAMFILMAADELMADQSYGEKVRQLHNVMHEVYWSEASAIYRSVAGNTVSAYDGYAFGALLSWLVSMQKQYPDLADFKKVSADHIKVILKDAGLLQSEGPDNGELRMPEDFMKKEVPPLVIQLQDTDVPLQGGPILELLKKAADQDGDRVPGVRFAGGKYGSAPVIIMETSVSTPFSPVGQSKVVDVEPKAAAEMPIENKGR